MTLHIDLLVAEIGSTTTTISAFDRLSESEPRFLGQAFHPTTVEEGDVLIGLSGATDALSCSLGVSGIEPKEMVATSSAAGGLKMTVHGLVYEMTVKAANEAALGAGAIVKLVTVGEISPDDLQRVRDLKPNIILLAGGVDHGERKTALFNARLLARLGLDIPIVYGGNIACRDEIERILGPKTCIADNVYPRIDQLNVEPTRKVIQEVFEEHIVQAPGMTNVREMVTGTIIPTPAAVMEAARLIRELIGDLVVVDVGGATTDIHSVTEGSEEIAAMLVAPEPFAKRTVEGDLGVFINAGHLAGQLGTEKMGRELGFAVEPLLDDWGQIPDDDRARSLVLRLTQGAAEIAISRHVGRTSHLYGPTGRVSIAEGKDLTAVRWLIGTGGPLTRLPGGQEVLEGIMGRKRPMALMPREAAVLIDRDYIMAAVGAIAQSHPHAAGRLLARSFGITLPVGV